MRPKIESFQFTVYVRGTKRAANIIADAFEGAIEELTETMTPSERRQLHRVECTNVEVQRP